MGYYYAIDESRIDTSLKVIDKARLFILGAERQSEQTLFYTGMWGAHTDVPKDYAAREDVHLLGYYNTKSGAESRPATAEEKASVRAELEAAKIKAVQEAMAAHSM